MKSMQRKFGGLMKRKEDEADVGQVLAEFRAVDDMLTQLVKDLTAYRNSWDDILKLQYDTTEAFADLYKPIEPSSDPDMRRPPTQTPQSYMQKCLGLQKLYSDLKMDLYQELTLIEQKLIKPAEEAKAATKGLGKTLKHRENAKLDYERYLSRAEHARRKETRTIKEEAALAAHESNLAQAQVDYETADDQVRQTFPPVTAAVLTLLPYLQANQVMLQTTLVGQLYTVMDNYTRTHRMANPSPGDAEIVREWESEFTGLRKELEQSINVISNGKTVQQASLALPAEKGSTITGLGLRNKAGGMMHKGGQPGSPSGEHDSSMTGLGIRNKAGGMMHKGGQGSPSAGGEGSSMTGLGIRNKAGGMMHRPTSGRSTASGMPERPMIGQRQGSSGMSGAMTVYDESEEVPPRPPRPGGAGGMSPSIPMGSKPRIGSPNPTTAPYPHDQKTAAITPAWPNNPPPPSYDQASTTASSPPSRYQTPLNGSSASHASDYFTDTNTAKPPTTQRMSMASSLASSAAAAKKKPPPPAPTKRFPSNTQQEYVTALYDFEGQNEGDLSFREGERIRVVHRTGSVEDWWEGEVEGGGSVGSFPANYVRVG